MEYFSYLEKRCIWVVSWKLADVGKCIAAINDYTLLHISPFLSAPQ